MRYYPQAHAVGRFLTSCVHVCVFVCARMCLSFYTSISTAQNVTSLSTNITAEKGKCILVIATGYWFLLTQPITWMYPVLVQCTCMLVLMCAHSLPCVLKCAVELSICMYISVY